MNYSLYKIRDRLFVSIIVLCIISCKKAIEVNPPFTSLNAGNVYTTDATAVAVLTDMFSQMSAQNITLTAQDITSISLYAGLSADELTLYALNNLNPLGYYRNDLNKINSQPNYWNAIYPVIFVANNAIEGLNASTGLTPSVKQQLLGEAKFMRAFCYFYLTNIYGDVPLVLTTNYKENALLARTSQTQIYQQIIIDLIEAKNIMSSHYLKGDAATAYASGEEERVRPTKWAATALLARTYLYQQKWDSAEAQATLIINNSPEYGLVSLNNAFLKNNQEAIWQLQPVGNNANSNTGEGKIFVLPASGPNTSKNPVYLSNNVVNAFEIDDQRKVNWIANVMVGNTIYYYAYKYKIGNVVAATNEYPTIFRLAEQYLIRAEARAQQNKIDDAVIDLNMIRTRAGLSGTDANDKTSLLASILHERQMELFTEWGHRWFDLKRTININSVMSIVTPSKGGSWSSFKQLWPIPQTEINNDPNLIQNPGY